MSCQNTENVHTYKFKLVEPSTESVELNLCPNCYNRWVSKRNGIPGEIINSNPDLICDCELPNCH